MKNDLSASLASQDSRFPVRTPWPGGQIPDSFLRFFFKPISSAGFGLMRIGFGLALLYEMLLQWPDIVRYYGPDGILPQSMASTVLRGVYRFSILDYVPNGQVTFALYIAFLIALVLATLGLWTRVTLLITTIILFSFHEYGTYALDGGDTLLRLIAFILLIAPSGRSLSIDNLRKRLKLVRATGKDQPARERAMPIWPYRLWLWQMIWLYITAAWFKMSGTMWLAGTAAAVPFHHIHFSRFSPQAADFAANFSGILSYFTLMAQLPWVLLFLIPVLEWSGTVSRSWRLSGITKRALILAGIVEHGGIFLTMNVGVFSLAVFVAYLGLLIDEDIEAIKKGLNHWVKGSIVVLYDGRCGFCRKTVFALALCDWLKRLTFVNMYDPMVKKQYAPDIPMEELQQQMHVKLSDGSFKKGFLAFRELSKNLLPLWLLVPLLYIPGMTLFGGKVYGWVAEHRK